MICSVCCNHNPALPSNMTYHRYCHKSNTTVATYRAGTAYYSGAHELTPVFNRVRGVRSLILCVMFCRLVFVLCLLTVVLYVLHRFKGVNHPFGIFKFYLDSARLNLIIYLL